MTAPADFSKETLERFARAVVARETVEDLYHQAFGPGLRTLHRLRKSLPLSLIPVALAWTMFVVLGAPASTQDSLRLYLAGLFLIALAALGLVGLVGLTGRRALPDSVLERLADGIDGLAFYPNAQLKDRIREKGYASLQDFYAWRIEQDAILATRLRDFKAQRQRDLTGAQPAETEVLSSAARRFLDI